MRESFYIQVIVWGNTILIISITKAILLRYEVSCMAYKPKCYQIKNAVKCPYPTSIQKCKILIIITQTIKQLT